MKVIKSSIDFYSNDYLSLARNDAIYRAALKQVEEWSPEALNGSTGSRLISGHSCFFEEVERYLAELHHAESALLYNSGFQANVGVVSSVLSRGDTLLYDSLIHASLRDGLSMTRGRSWSFRHNDLSDLATKAERATGDVFVLVESVYSMDGDKAPLVELARLCEDNGWHLIVDEAHAVGVYGENGVGLVQSLGLTDKVLIRIHTFGKGLGTHGAVVMGCMEVITFLINYSRAFVYTTAMPAHTLATIKAAYHHLCTSPSEYNKLWEIIQHFKEMCNVKQIPTGLISPNESPIQVWMINNIELAQSVASSLQECDMGVKAILSPTVPAGEERIRICLHAHNTHEEIELLTDFVTKHIK